MGRTAGATAAGTRERLLRAAADVFAGRGYDGTRVSDIADAAGLSNGALYAYFGSKVELLLDALRAHGGRPLADLVAAPMPRPPPVTTQTPRELVPRLPPPSLFSTRAACQARRRGP